LGLLQLALALLFLIRQLLDSALQLCKLGLVDTIALFELFGHVGKGNAVLVERFKCTLFIRCKTKDLKLEISNKVMQS
jgi:hypothetical protein